MTDFEEVLKRFGFHKLPVVKIVREESRVKAEELKIMEEINSLKWLAHSLKKEFEEVSEEAQRWRRFYESYSKFYKELDEIRNYLDSILFEIKAARKEEITNVNTLLRRIGEKRIAFTNILEMLSEIESAPFRAKVDALSELKEVFKEEVFERGEERGVGGTEERKEESGKAG